MISLIPFQASHMSEFSNRDIDYSMESKLHRDKETLGPAFTAIEDGRIVGCAGIMILWPGVGIAWCAFSDAIIKHKLWMTRHVSNVLRDTIKSFNLHRVEAVVLADNDRNAEWIELLGFTKEKDIAQKYTQDRRDVVRYEYVIDAPASHFTGG